MHWGHYRNRFSIRHSGAGLKLHDANNRQLGTRYRMLFVLDI